MSITAKETGNVCVLTIAGEFSGPNVEEFRRQVEQCSARDCRDFVVDFAEATGVDSAGLEALTWLQRESTERLGLLKLCNLSDPLKKVFEVTRLDRQFERYEFVEEALQSFA